MCIRDRKAAFTLLFNNGDSVRQALAEDTANQLAKLGIEVTVEGVGWDTAVSYTHLDVYKRQVRTR